MFGLQGYFQDNLFDEFRRMERRMDEVFGAHSTGLHASARGSHPPVNVGVTPDQVNVYLFAAGVDPESLDITIRQNLLTIEGERKTTQDKDTKQYRSERFNGAFRRVLTLPEDVDPERVDAGYKDGVLTIEIQRRESSKPRRIKVN